MNHQIVNQPTLHFSRLCMYVDLLLFEAADYRYNFCCESSSNHDMEVKPKDFILCTSVYSKTVIVFPLELFELYFCFLNQLHFNSFRFLFSVWNKKSNHPWNVLFYCFIYGNYFINDMKVFQIKILVSEKVCFNFTHQNKEQFRLDK